LEAAIGRTRFEGCSYREYIPYQQRLDRAERFFAGYQRSGGEDPNAEPILRAFEIATCLGSLKTHHVDYSAPYTPGAYLSTRNDTYTADPSTFYNQQDFRLSMLEHEEILRRKLEA
jgi:hypothetical protein